MMDEKNQLNDIILNKGTSANNNKKIILAVATLGVILIIVVMLMNSLTSSGTDNLPQAVLPPKPNAQATEQVPDEPLFEDVEVVQDKNQDSNNLDKIAQKLKEESKMEAEAATKAEEDAVETETIPEPVQVKEVPKKVVAPVKAKTPAPKIAASGSYYIQVGSFTKYAPDKKFLKSITDKGFAYKYHKVTQSGRELNKVLVGPFATEKDARNALRTIRSNIEAGAFLIKL